MSSGSTMEYLSGLRARKVVLSLEGAQLRVSAPPGELTPELRAEIAGQRAEIVHFLQQNGSAREAAKIPRVAREGPMPLSFAQQRLWYLGQVAGASEAYNIPWIFRLTGGLNGAALRRALDRLMVRHEALRTSFAVQDGEPVQRVAVPEGCRFPLVEEDLRTSLQPEAELRQRIELEASAPFDLEHGPVIRGRLIRMGDAEHVLALCVHHIAVDGWSMEVLARELGLLYNAFVRGVEDPLPEVEIQCADYAAWQRQWMQGEQQEEQAAYWAAALQDAPTLLELPVDYPRPAVQDYAGGWEELVLEPELTARLKTFCARHRVTLFMALLSAWAVLLARLSGREDLLIASPAANRGGKEGEDVVGFFANTLVLRLNLAGSPSVADLLAQTRTRCLEALRHQEFPFEQVVELTHAERSLSHAPLVQVMFAWQNSNQTPPQMEGLAVEPLAADRTRAKFDLLLELEERDGQIAGGIEFAASLFERATIRRYAGYLRTLLEAMLGDDRRPIDRLPLMPPAERRQILEEFAVAPAPYPRDKCVQQLFEEVAAEHPGAVAVEQSGQTLSYRELNEQANRLAHNLRELGVRPDSRVAVCVERSRALPVALLAIVKAGGAYVPLDPAYPAERLQWMLRDSAPVALLTQRSLRGIFAGWSASLPVLDLMDEQGEWKSRPVTDPDGLADEVKPDNVAYVIYTSGSTGQPKGVMVPHRGIVRLVRGANYASFAASDRFLQMAPISFDAATLEIWGALLNGATLVLLPQERPTVEQILRTVQEQRISVLWLTTPLFNVIVDTAPGALGGVRQVLTGGDTASPSHMRRFAAALNRGHCLVNAYGPTENTTFTTCYRICAAREWKGSVPIGRPISNSTVYILDRWGEPVPIGVPGELFTGGDGVALGYQNRPELSAERFLPDPFRSTPGARMYRTGDLARWLPDGNIEFLGRNDFQVKIRGFRVELGEIEARLGEHPGLRSVVVVCREDRPGDKRLVAYFTAEEDGVAGRGLDSADLRAHLSTRLPEYMLPSAYVRLEALPLNPAGKVDRRGLPAPGEESFPGQEYEPPRDATEARLAGIWEEVLHRKRVGRQDNFFALGGDSILSLKVISKAQSAGLPLTVNAMIAHQTIAELVSLLNAQRRTEIEI